MNSVIHDHFNCCPDAPVCNGIAHGLQFIVSSLFYRILSLEVYNVRTLFSLFITMTANFHQRLDHPLKSIHLIIPHNEVTGLFHRRKNIGIFPFFYFSLSCHEGKNKNNILGSRLSPVAFLFTFFGWELYACRF